MAHDLDLLPQRPFASPAPQGLGALQNVPHAKVLARLHSFERNLERAKRKLIGYPEAQWFDFGPLLRFIRRFNLDNLGVGALRYAVNSTEFETEAIADLIQLYRGNPTDMWGYVTSSGTEGNIYGCYLGREALPDGVLYYSSSTHYSVPKAAKLLGLKQRQQMIPSQPHGEVDYDLLEAALVAELSGRGRPPIIVANVGTTMTGAIDDVSKIVDILRRHRIDEFYIHVDAALSGMVLPFLPAAPPLTFEQPIGSLSVSIHKFLGAPFPCGVVLTREDHAKRIETEIDYIGSVDRTLGGSRNGHAPLYLWYALRTRGAEDGLVQEVADCRALAEYVHDRLVAMGVRDVLLLDHSLTVVFPEPSEALVATWSLATKDGFAHIITVPGATRRSLDEFLDAFEAERRLSRQGTAQLVASGR